MRSTYLTLGIAALMAIGLGVLDTSSVAHNWATMSAADKAGFDAVSEAFNGGQLVVNTSTTILTYLLGILILLEANRQSKESKVVHDELIKAIRGARNELINIDQMTEEEIDLLEARLRRRARPEAPQGRSGKATGGGAAPGRRGTAGSSLRGPAER